MIDNAAAPEKQGEAPLDVLSSPALLFLYHRIEQIIGIKAGYEPLKMLNAYIEKECGSSFIDNPSAFEYLLSSREKIFEISKFLTVNETYFFREGVHFEILKNLLPELAKLKRTLQICCAAVSIGCEAYSAAMLVDYLIKNGLEIDYTVDAFDICNEAIETAKNARFTSNAFRNDGICWKYILDSYLIPDNGEYIIPQNIRDKVRFFSHNIMNGLDSQYDIIFFRNALIYFSIKNRLFVINNLSESLNNNGYLFLGISETSSVSHPLLANRYASDAFYFQKNFICETIKDFSIIQKEKKAEIFPENKNINLNNESVQDRLLSFSREPEISVNYTEVSDFLKIKDGKPNAEDVIIKITTRDTAPLSGSCIVSAAVYFLNSHDFENADKTICFLEKNNSSACTKYLRGEYNFLKENNKEAEKYYQEAAIKDKYFWPAFYRIAALSSEGNQTRHEYKIKKAIESINLLKNHQREKEYNFECFTGGFSYDYFLKALEKKLKKIRGTK